MNLTERENWEKHVDKAVEKFREQAFKAVYQYHGSTYSSIAADVLATAYAIMVKSADIKEAENKIFTQEFLSGRVTSK